MDGLTLEQQRKAVNFSVCFLREETESLKQAIATGIISLNIKKQAERRLAELEKDLATFEKLNDKFSL